MVLLLLGEERKEEEGKKKKKTGITEDRLEDNNRLWTPVWINEIRLGMEHTAKVSCRQIQV